MKKENSIVKSMSQDQEINDDVKFKYMIGSKFRLANPIDEIAFLNLEKQQHKLLEGAWKLNFASPIEQGLKKGKGFKVLDVRCGSGTWTLQLSKAYPLTKFVGLDTSSTFPKSFPQTNLQFIQYDILKGLPFEDDSFDFVHARFLFYEFTQEQWEEIVIKELIRICKPGGWIELVDILVDGKSMGPAHKRLLTFYMKYLDSKGINCQIAEEIPGILESFDQIDKVYTDEIITTIGKSGGELGKLAVEFFLSSFHIYKSAFTWLEMSEEEHDTMVGLFVEQTENHRSYFISQRSFCQKNAS